MYLSINLNESKTYGYKIKNNVSIAKALKKSVSMWSVPEASTLPCVSLFRYFPSSMENLTKLDEEVRHLIWDFKGAPPYRCPYDEILSRHKEAVDFILPYMVAVIDEYFGNLKSELTLVCVPASQRTKHRLRFKDFSLKLCDLTGMQNGHRHVRITKDGDATHYYHENAEEMEYDIDDKYFSGRNILFFDDIVTSGATIERFKKELEEAGANVIGAITIGKTCYKYVD